MRLIQAQGILLKAAESFWNIGAADGFDVVAGGAAAHIDDPATRSAVTYTGAYNNISGVFTPSVAAAAVLTAGTNEVDKSNLALTNALLGLSVTSSEKVSGIPRRETLIDWARGTDVLDMDGDSDVTDARLDMGAPLHSQPALVQYGGTEAAPDLVAYVATNDGYLHAFDVDDGSELFSFIPQELLPNLNGLMDNDTGITYGLDGDVVAWINDENEDGTISGAGEHVYLYIGMRRGGRNIYSVDVTDRTNPSLRWVIKGGSGDYAELGQTWSSVNVEQIKDGASEKTVLIFGGGYDTNQDDVTERTVDSVGRAVFIADADTGELLWSASAGTTGVEADMKYSIPARVKPLDLSGDGNVDRLYVADMGGQIFRFDINEELASFSDTSVSGGLIADFASSGEANARRFYYPPDVALIAERGEAPYLALAITSGYRAHPLDTEIQDRIYLFKDTDVYDKPAIYTTLSETDLFDATLNTIADDATKAAAKVALNSKKGWFIKLDDQTGTDTWLGEKGLSEALILNGVVITTTFIPGADSTITSCGPQSGVGTVYFIDLLDGTAAYPSDGDTRSDRQRRLVKGGIPPTPNVIITKGGEPTLCVGTECEKAEFGLGARKTYWYEEN